MTLEISQAPSLSSFRFEQSARDGNARAGVLTTPHGIIHTPIFMPVGTQCTANAMTTGELKSLGTEILLGNTYHLHLRPGDELIRELGGLHRFMNWQEPILTDSGGFQVFSLAKLLRREERVVVFRSHHDGARVELTPEISIGIQQNLGSTIMMCFDECPALPATRSSLEESLALTTRWARRCKEARTTEQALFGIVQGGTEVDLRLNHLESITEIGFDGYALGGLSVGESKEEMYPVLHAVTPRMPEDRPRYLMGVGDPLDLLEAMEAGIDMFDCVMPTRNARNGSIFTTRGKLSIKQARFREDPRPLDETCSCETCTHYSRAYLRHLFQSGEILGHRLHTLHNLHFLLEMTRQARSAILSGTYLAFKQGFLERYHSGLDD